MGQQPLALGGHGAVPRPDGFLRGWLPRPEELGLSVELGRRLAVWSRQWQDNCLMREDATFTGLSE